MRMLTKFGQEIFGPAYDPEKFSDVITPVDITPAAKWFYSVNPQERYDAKDDFATLAPPWPATWMEFSTPRSINTEGEIKYGQFADLKRIGVYIMGGEADDLGGKDHPVKKVIGGLVDEVEVRGMEGSISAPDGAKWWLAWSFYVATRNEVENTGIILDFLNEDGQLIYLSEDEGRLSMPGHRQMQMIQKGTIDAFQVSDFLHTLALPFEFATSLIHCNNVELTEDSVPDAVKKKRRKTGKNPGQTFKCLELDAIKRRSQSESEDGESDVERALHICRGHFKTYTEENPLFGQHTGTYWWPMHVRGSEDAGEVNKSYRVNSPNY